MNVIFPFAVLILFGRFPFDWKNPIGFLVAVILQTIMISYPLRYMSCYTRLALGSYLFAITFVRDTIDEANDFSDSLRKSRSKLNAYKKISEIIQVHAEGKRSSLTKMTDEYLTATAINILFFVRIRS